MAIQQNDLLIGFGAAAVISIISRRMGLLTLGGAIASTVVGGAIFGSGTLSLPASLLWFFITSNLLGRFRRRKKEQLGYEKHGARDTGQVFANGAVAAIAALSSTIIPHMWLPLMCASLAAIASAAADTWATEIGSACGSPTYLITTLERVPSGRSGGISLPGSLAAILGASSTASIAFGFGLKYFVVCVIAALCGVLGCAVDSLLGATLQAQFRNPDGNVVEQRSKNTIRIRGVRWITNDTVNFISCAIASVCAYGCSLYVMR
jgi:uncharacterized protein (TIGR00297 family)